MSTISKTGLDYIEKSPLDYWWRFVNPEREPYVKDKNALFDDALRMAALNPSLFATTYVKQPVHAKPRSQTAQYEKQVLLDAVTSNGQMLISASDYATIQEMVSALKKHPVTSRLFLEGVTSETLHFTEQQSGAVVMFKPHWIYKNAVIVNLISGAADRESFAKLAANMNLHKRAAIQIDGTRAEDFLFVMIEKEAPHKIQVHSLDQRSIEFGRMQYLKNCKTFVECLQKGNWPGLPEKIDPVSLPEWAFKQY